MDVGREPFGNIDEVSAFFAGPSGRIRPAGCRKLASDRGQRSAKSEAL
jgi:hypothetical protein